MKIGLIDYMIDEWHANNYPAWIELACETLGVAAAARWTNIASIRSR